jgi:signal transduction histidine kinase
MRISLMYKLIAAFVVVVLASAGITAVVANRTAGAELDLFVSEGNQLFVRDVGRRLEVYYQILGTWNGVDSFVEQGLTIQAPDNRQRGRRLPQQLPPPLWAASGDQRLIIADASNTVVYDTDGEFDDRQLPYETLKSGLPLTIQGLQIGTVALAASANTELQEQFLSNFNRGILIGAVATGIAAIGIAALLAWQIIAPLRKLTAAAQGVAAGRFHERVAISSGDEVGQLADAFNEMTEKLELSEDQRRRMLADVAHELRNPLTTIQGSLEGIVDGVLPLDRERIVTMYDQTIVLSRLVDDLRLISLAEANQLPLNRTPTPINDLVEQVAEDFRPLAQETGVNLEVDVPEQSLPVSVDPQRISQVLANLLSNALRYGGDGELNVRMLDVNNHVEVSVKDSGPGIERADLDHIFDRFYRHEKSRSRVAGGSGLGLAIVKELVEAHGGSVRAESEVGRGSTFIFTLPRSASAG